MHVARPGPEPLAALIDIDNAITIPTMIRIASTTAAATPKILSHEYGALPKHTLPF